MGKEKKTGATFGHQPKQDQPVQPRGNVENGGVVEDLGLGGPEGGLTPAESQETLGATLEPPPRVPPVYSDKYAADAARTLVVSTDRDGRQVADHVERDEKGWKVLGSASADDTCTEYSVDPSKFTPPEEERYIDAPVTKYQHGMGTEPRKGLEEGRAIQKELHDRGKDDPDIDTRVMVRLDPTQGFAADLVDCAASKLGRRDKVTEEWEKDFEESTTSGKPNVVVAHSRGSIKVANAASKVIDDHAKPRLPEARERVSAERGEFVPDPVMGEEGLMTAELLRETQSRETQAKDLARQEAADAEMRNTHLVLAGNATKTPPKELEGELVNSHNPKPAIVPDLASDGPFFHDDTITHLFGTKEPTGKLDYKEIPASEESGAKHRETFNAERKDGGARPLAKDQRMNHQFIQYYHEDAAQTSYDVQKRAAEEKRAKEAESSAQPEPEKPSSGGLWGTISSWLPSFGSSGAKSDSPAPRRDEVEDRRDDRDDRRDDRDETPSRVETPEPAPVEQLPAPEPPREEERREPEKRPSSPTPEPGFGDNPFSW